jgi:hypothetical protein
MVFMRASQLSVVLPPLHVSSVTVATNDTHLGKGAEPPLHPHFASIHAAHEGSEVAAPGSNGAPRPKKRGAKGGRTRTLTLRLSVEEHATIEAKARDAGLSIGSFLRACSLGSPGPRARRQPPLNAELLAYAMAQLNRVGNNYNQHIRLLNAAGPTGSDQVLQALEEVRSAVRRIFQILNLG